MPRQDTGCSCTTHTRRWLPVLSTRVRVASPWWSRFPCTAKRAQRVHTRSGGAISREQKERTAIHQIVEFCAVMEHSVQSVHEASEICFSRFWIALSSLAMARTSAHSVHPPRPLTIVSFCHAFLSPAFDPFHASHCGCLRLPRGAGQDSIPSARAIPVLDRWIVGRRWQWGRANGIRPRRLHERRARGCGRHQQWWNSG